jgi:hypothetical protein
MTAKEFVLFPPAVMPKWLGLLWREAWMARFRYLNAPALFRCTTAEAAAEIFHTAFFREAMQTQTFPRLKPGGAPTSFANTSPLTRNS